MYDSNVKHKGVTKMKNSIRIGVDIDDCMCNTLEMDFCCAYYKYKKLNKLHDDIDKTYDICVLINRIIQLELNIT